MPAGQSPAAHLISLLSDGSGIAIELRKFMANMYCEEYYDCWLALENFKEDQGGNLVEKARAIYRDYFDADSDSCVTVEYFLVAKMEKEIVSPNAEQIIDQNYFIEAQNSVFTVIFVNIYKQFIASDVYLTFGKDQAETPKELKASPVTGGKVSETRTPSDGTNSLLQKMRNFLRSIFRH